MALPQYTLSWGNLNYLSYYSRARTWAITDLSPLALTLVPSSPLMNPLVTGNDCYVCTEIFNTNYLTVDEKDGAYWAYWVNSQSDATTWQLFIDPDRSTGMTIPMGCSTVQLYTAGSSYGYGPGYVTNGGGKDPPYVGWANTDSAYAIPWTIEPYSSNDRSS